MSWQRLRNELWELITGLVFAYILWLLLCFLLNTSSPLSDVTSCSMLPNLELGDMVLLKGERLEKLAQVHVLDCVLDLKNMRCGEKGVELLRRKVRLKGRDGRDLGEAFETVGLKVNGKVLMFEEGPIVVYYSKELGAPVVHRAVLLIRDSEGLKLLTKGDNNLKVDQEVGIGFVTQENLIGVVIFRVPLLGYVKALLFGALRFEGCDRVIS